MALSSEQAHWIVGGELSLLALTLMLYETRLWRSRGLRYALAAVLLLFAAEGVVIPVLEGAARPENLDTATVQHFMMAGVCCVTGVVELVRAAGGLHQRGWRAAVPLGMMAMAVLFAVHANPKQHEPTHASSLLVTVQHRTLAASLAAGAMAKTAAELPHRTARWFRVAWLLPVLLAGVQLLLYREGA